MMKYPINTNNAVKLTKLIHICDKLPISDLSSTRMIKCASILPENEFIGWQMYIPTKGLVDMSFFGSESINHSDLEWIGENCAKAVAVKITDEDVATANGSLYKLFLNISSKSPSKPIGFGNTADTSVSYEHISWPTAYSNQFGELVKLLRDEGAALRFTFGKPDNFSAEQCRHGFERSWSNRSIDGDTYFGKPIKASLLMCLPGTPSIRLKSIIDEAIPGLRLMYLGSMNNRSSREIWENPLAVANVVPEYTARILMMEPLMLSDEPIIGIETCEKEQALLPASHENPKSKSALTIGTALCSSGEFKKIKIDDTALKMHWDLVGMSGTGKSSLLTRTVLSAIETNHSCTVMDPHGGLVDSIIRCVPEKYASRIKVIRLGDADKNPVPIRLHKTNDPEQEEIAVNNLCSMFQEIFDPHNEGYVGPRWIRIYSLLSKCSIALGLGGTFQSILTLAQSKDNLKKALEALGRKHDEKDREIFEGISSELLEDRSNDYQQLISWFVSKFQRLTAIPQLRNVFGTAESADALNFSEIIDSNFVVLIDLSSPVIGTDAARIAGTLLVNQLWDAVLARKDRIRNHIFVVDEAHLFSGAGSRLGRIIYEGRKFGISLIMAHQNCTQLSPDIREALASTANFSSFRLSVKDAYEAAARFDNEAFRSKLCRLNNFNAVTSLSINGCQCEPFTLQIMKPRNQNNHKTIAAKIEEQSLNELVVPYRSIHALTTPEILARIMNFGLVPASKPESADERDEPIFIREDDEFLTRWNKKKAA